MEKADYRIEVYYRELDFRGEVLQKRLSSLGYPVSKIVITDNYLVHADISASVSEKIAGALIQPVTQDYHINTPCDPGDFNCAIEIGYLPGVTDNVSHTTREMIEDIVKTSLDPEKSVFTTTTYFVWGDINRELAEKIALELYNPLIQRMKVKNRDQYITDGGMGVELPLVNLHERTEVDTVNLDLPEEDLAVLGREGIPDSNGSRRGPLALDMLSMNVIQNYFKDREKRNPTDVELESIAQTWSEHCKHTIFAAKIDDVDEGIFRQYIREATVVIRRNLGKNDFCVSVFSDNAGGIEFDENYVIADKVETHNSPSALDPFGGSITGIVGVNRDAIGFGLGSKPVANRYGFCFASPFDNKPLYRSKDKSSRMLSPRRIMEGVIHGVNVGGNNSGIPTPQGFIYFDPRYKGKPLVFVGTVGLIPREINGKSSVQKKAMPGDCVVMVGGRVGLDGIHGATFSSEALSSGSPATAVQIGDPITQKKLSDAIVKEARDRGLYSSITDNGAGGLSCSVAEMAQESGGFEVELEKVPLKYPGMAPWQIWVSESQERMTLAVPEENCEEFLTLMERRGVEATIIGRFTDTGRGIVTYNGKKVFDLDLHFLHEGLPRKELKTTYTKRSSQYPEFSEPDNYPAIMADMVGRLNTASYEFITRQYDHEVQGNSVIKPLHGKGEVNAPATVIRPVFSSRRGVVLSQGLYPSYGDIDTYWMAACSIDTSIRNIIAAGGTLDRMALLDNFCWCDSNNPERLGQLKEAAKACYDLAVAYGTPYVSGKDSMFNDFRGYDEDFNEVEISVPPTLLISSIGVTFDIDNCQTIDFKAAGDRIYVMGITRDELGGSEYLACMGEKISGEPYVGNTVPKVNVDENMKTYRALETSLRKGLIASSTSVERGGLWYAIARSSMAALTGCRVRLDDVPVEAVSRGDDILFSESQGRVLVSVSADNAQAFETLCSDIPCACIGEVTGDSGITVAMPGRQEEVRTDVDTLMSSYKGLLKNF